MDERLDRSIKQDDHDLDHGRKRSESSEIDADIAAFVAEILSKDVSGVSLCPKTGIQ